MVKVTAPESSAAEHEAMVRDAELLLEALELPYRRMRLCAGDIGFGARLCYDLEVPHRMPAHLPTHTQPTPR